MGGAVSAGISHATLWGVMVAPVPRAGVSLGWASRIPHQLSVWRKGGGWVRMRSVRVQRGARVCTKAPDQACTLAPANRGAMDDVVGRELTR